MADARAEITVNATPDATWAVVRDFHGLDAWMPGIDELVSEGDDRVLSMMGMSIRERLVHLDEDGLAITYTIVEGAPVESHQATITVVPEGDGCLVTWDVSATPDEMAGFMQGMYQQALEPLKAKAESAA
jgi:carbon monoxide dehydrogenase subunit G